MYQVETSEHKKALELLKTSEGIWDVQFEKFIWGPEDSPALSRGVDENRILTDGLWLTMNQQYEFPGGVFQGRAIYGYDPKLEKYVGMWVDSTNAHLNVSEGMFDDESQTLTLIADGVDPTTGQRTLVRQQKVFKDQNTMVFSVYRAGEKGDYIQLLQVTAQRRNQGPAGVRRYEPFALSKAQLGFHHDWPSSRPTMYHNLLRREEGTWEATVASYMASPDGTPMLSKGTETNTLIGNGLWLVREVRNSTPRGLFEAREILGYDPEKGKYVGAWVDSTNPHRSVWEGTFDEDSQKLSLVAEGIDRTGERVKEMQVIYYKEDGLKEVTLYHVGADGKSRKVMEATARRQL